MPQNNYSATYQATSKRQQYEILRGQLEIERATFLTHWRELGDYILPRRPRFTITEVNRGERKNQKIIDSTATLSVRTLRSGMMGGVTSPARPWFKLSVADPDIADIPSVKHWLHTVTKRMATIFLKSNLYNTLPIIYGDLGCFGTAAMIVEEDFTGDVIRTYPFPIGSYMVANNDRLKVDVFFREFRLTIRQLIEKFGDRENNDGKINWNNFSTYVKDLWDKGQYESWIDVCHVIQPNPEFDGRKLESKYKKYLSCYYERGISGQNNRNYMNGPNDDTYLSEKGYDLFPILCPRWEITGEDVYGTDCPGMTALGDIKQLQLGERRAAQAIEKMIKPAMTGPTSMMNRTASILPGDITYVDVRDGQQGFKPAHELRDPHLQALEAKQDQVRMRIRKAFFEDLFLMLANDQRAEPPTAREIEERHEEKLLALGPVLEQLNQDQLDPLIDLTFDIMLRKSLDANGNFMEGAIVPEPPRELQGLDLKVEYVSIMAQAQKMLGIAGVERFTNFATNIVNMTKSPEVLDAIDMDYLLSTYADMTSVPPKILKTPEQVAAIRDQRAQQQQAAQAAEMAQQGAGAAKDLAAADTEGPNALTDMMDQTQAGQVVPQ